MFIATSKHLLIAEVEQRQDKLGFFPLYFGGIPEAFDIERGSLYFSTGKKIKLWQPHSNIPYNLDKKPFLRLKDPAAYINNSEQIPTEAKPTSSAVVIRGQMPDTIHELKEGNRKGRVRDVEDNKTSFKGGDTVGIFIDDVSEQTEIASINQDIGF